MTDGDEVKLERVQIGDRMAIIAAGIAIGIALISAPGLYTLTNIPIGLVLIMTLHAVDSRKDSNLFQSASFALAWALSFLVMAGLFLVNPYLTKRGVFYPDTGGSVIDQFTHIEIPAIGWIKHTFQGAASDVVSFTIVSLVAILWFALRRRFFAVHQKPSQQQDEVKDNPSSKSSMQSVMPPVQIEKQQEATMQTRSASTSISFSKGQRTEKKVFLTRVKEKMAFGVFTVAMALLVYILSRREPKYTDAKI